MIISFPILGKFSTIISSSIFSWSFFLSSSGTPMIRMLGHLTLSQRSQIVLISFNFFSMFHLFLPFYLLPHLSYLMPPLFYCWISIVCFLSHLLHYSLYIDYFISSRSLLNLSCIISILVSRLFICDSILFSRYWIIFTIIIQNSLSGRLPISSSFVWFGGHLSCSFTCWVFLSLFILFKLLSLGCPFYILAVCGVLFIVEFPSCGWGWTGGLSRFPG